MSILKCLADVNKKGQVTIPKTFREVAGISAESMVSITCNLITKKIEIEEFKTKFDKADIEFIKSAMLTAIGPIAIYIWGKAGVGKTTLVKELTKGLTIDGLNSEAKEHHFDEVGNIYVMEDIPVSERKIEIHPSKATIATSQERISIDNILNPDMLSIFVQLSPDHQNYGIQSIELNRHNQIIKWK
ncbi:hypothetical protein ACOMCU_01255 [Lysinibacillus sp. UGB7]|uniref:hypothetical protein n=1 Tax=Lysinibacillus sp. UGB7 TaxID=3411039 RepID=UPI003B7DA5E5